MENDIETHLFSDTNFFFDDSGILILGSFPVPLYTQKEKFNLLDDEEKNKAWYYSSKKSEFWKYYQLTPWFLERPIDAIQTILAQKYSDYEETKLKINDIRCFGVYHNRNTLEIVIFFIKIRIEMSFKNVNKIAWFIPVRKWREAFKRAFDV